MSLTFKASNYFISFLLSNFCFSLFLFTLSGKPSFLLMWSAVDSSLLSFEFNLMFDAIGCLFAGTVCLISAAVFLFSWDYMSTDKFFLRFHLLVLSFIASMMLLILSPNLVSMMLGWDGLGVTSFLLVIYFQSVKANNAGIITALSNRVGDALIIVSIALSCQLGFMDFWLWEESGGSMKKLLLVTMAAAACTKSAQLPFSAWLPAAMAAPTPVSALVHSSTLVTAGVYVLIRMSQTIMSPSVSKSLMTTGLLTLLIASFTALVEEDMKKVVALSTLSQLGLMMVTLASGFPKIAFFHLICHAFFKALLFMGVGSLIHFSNDFQDLRKISVSSKAAPVSVSSCIIAMAGLCGLPFTSGFFSKDMCVDQMSEIAYPPIFWACLMASVSLTAAYSSRFLASICFLPKNSMKAKLSKESSFPLVLGMLMLSPPAVAGGGMVLITTFTSPAYVPQPLCIKALLFMVLMFGFIFGSQMVHSHKTKPSTTFLVLFNLCSLAILSGSKLSMPVVAIGSAMRTNLDNFWSANLTVSATKWASTSMVEYKNAFNASINLLALAGFVLLLGGLVYLSMPTL